MVLLKLYKTNTLDWKALYLSRLIFIVCLQTKLYSTFFEAYITFGFIFSLNYERYRKSSVTGSPGSQPFLVSSPTLMPRNKHIYKVAPHLLPKQLIPLSDDWCLESADWCQAEIYSPAPSLIPICPPSCHRASLVTFLHITFLPILILSP